MTNPGEHVTEEPQEVDDRDVDAATSDCVERVGPLPLIVKCD